MTLKFLWLASGFLFFTSFALGQEPPFSGPQPGEPLQPFTFRAVFEDAGKEVDPIKVADGKPIVLIFIHDVNRQSISMTRTLTTYTNDRKKEGLHTGVILLCDDPNNGEIALNRSKHAFTPSIPTGVSLNGLEGPGSYGLNRNVMLTILVGKDSKVTSNFALIQPSLNVDLPKVVESITKLIGGKPPTTEELVAKANPGQMNRERPNEPAKPDMRSLLVPLIQKTATEEQVDQAAKNIEEQIAKDEAVKKEIARISTTIVNSGKLDDYGTKKAREYLSKWAKELGSPKNEKVEQEKK